MQTSDDESSDGEEPFPLAVSGAVGVDERGRDYVATAQIAEGAVLLRVAPTAIVPTERFLGRVCSGCLRPCTAADLCGRCGATALCTECCDDGRAVALHAEECAALFALRQRDETLPQELRLLLRVVSAIALERAGELPSFAVPAELDVVVDRAIDVELMEDHGEALGEETLAKLQHMAARVRSLGARRCGSLDDIADTGLAHSSGRVP